MWRHLAMTLAVTLLKITQLVWQWRVHMITQLVWQLLEITQLVWQPLEITKLVWVSAFHGAWCENCSKLLNWCVSWCGICLPYCLVCHLLRITQLVCQLIWHLKIAQSACHGSWCLSCSWKKSLTSSLSGHLVNGFHLILSFIDDKYVIDDTM